jgi:hypothetical protein
MEDCFNVKSAVPGSRPIRGVVCGWQTESKIRTGSTAGG